MKIKHYKEDNTKFKYTNEFIHNMGLGDLTICVYQGVFKIKVMTQILLNILLYMD